MSNASPNPSADDDGLVVLDLTSFLAGGEVGGGKSVVFDAVALNAALFEGGDYDWLDRLLFATAPEWGPSIAAGNAAERRERGEA